MQCQSLIQKIHPFISRVGITLFTGRTLAVFLLFARKWEYTESELMLMGLPADNIAAAVRHLVGTGFLKRSRIDGIPRVRLHIHGMLSALRATFKACCDALDNVRQDDVATAATAANRGEFECNACGAEISDSVMAGPGIVVTGDGDVICPQCGEGILLSLPPIIDMSHWSSYVFNRLLGWLPDEIEKTQQLLDEAEAMDAIPRTEYIVRMESDDASHDAAAAKKAKRTLPAFLKGSGVDRG